MSACIGEPVSWLRLERYALGELSGEEQRAVLEHLASCETCRACSERIGQDVREPLQLRAAAPALPVRRRPLLAAGPWAALVGAGLAAWLMVRTPPPPPSAAATGAKGGELALTVVRRDAAGRLLEPTRFAPGDRFKHLLTCAPPLQGPVRVQVFQGGEVYEPVPAQSLPQCGNRLALSGAWQLDGREPLDICAVFSRPSSSDGADPRTQARSVNALAELALPYVCAHLEPAP